MPLQLIKVESHAAFSILHRILQEKVVLHSTWCLNQCGRHNEPGITISLASGITMNVALQSTWYQKNIGKFFNLRIKPLQSLHQLNKLATIFGSMTRKCCLEAVAEIEILNGGASAVNFPSLWLEVFKST